MTQITFISFYNEIELNINITSEAASLMFHNKNYEPMELYINDCDRVNEGYNPIYFTKSQIKKINSYLTDTDVWKTVSITKQLKMTTKEIVSNINSNGGFDNFRGWNKSEIAEWVTGNFPCSKSVAKNVAFEIA